MEANNPTDDWTLRWSAAGHAQVLNALALGLETDLRPRPAKGEAQEFSTPWYIVPRPRGLVWFGTRDCARGNMVNTFGICIHTLLRW